MSDLDKPPESPEVDSANDPVRADVSVPTTSDPTPPAPEATTSPISQSHATEANKPEPRGPLPLRFRDQILFAVVSATALVFMTIYCVRTSHWGAEPIELERQPQRELDFKIDLNDSTWVEWSQLPGIGPVLSHRIVEDREKNGPFRNIDDLDRVKGIGPKKIDALRPYVRVESKPNSEADERGE